MAAEFESNKLGLLLKDPIVPLFPFPAFDVPLNTDDFHLLYVFFYYGLRKYIHFTLVSFRVCLRSLFDFFSRFFLLFWRCSGMFRDVPRS